MRSETVMFRLARVSPNSPRLCAPVRCSTASRSALEGIVPVLIDAPPSTFCFSMMATDFPSLEAWIAAFCPAGPVPITMQSKWRMGPEDRGWRIEDRGEARYGSRISDCGVWIAPVTFLLMAFDQYHEPPDELSAEVRTFARM